MEPEAPELPDGPFPGSAFPESPFPGPEPRGGGWTLPEDGGSAEELLAANPDDVCGLGGHLGPQDGGHDPPAATAALYEVVCELGAPLQGSVVSIQLDPWLCPTLLPGSCISTEQPPPAPPMQLHLTEEEQRLLAQEGVTLPGTLPLTQAQERILRKVRRKIRNKRSAQDSRRRRKEYLDGLESRVAACSAQNRELREKVQELEKHNGSLLRQLQELITQTATRAAQTGPCTLILLLSLALILLPSYSPLPQDSPLPPGVRSRNILAQVEPPTAPSPSLGGLRVTEGGGWGGHGARSPPLGRELDTNSSGRAPPWDTRGHGDEM